MNRTKAFASSLGVTLMRDNPMTPLAGMVAYITSTYATGWQNGDIRRCYLSDVSVGAVSGAERFADAGFDAPASWVVDNDWVVSGSKANYTNSNTGIKSIRPATPVPVTAGEWCAFTFTVSGIAAGTGWLGLFADGSGNNIVSSASVPSGVTINGSYFNFTANGTYTVFFKSAFTGANVYLWAPGGTAANYSLDSISLVSAVADRSYKASALKAHGTLTRAQVGVGSQLVAYSGFSAANYLQEAAYSADLDFGTGGFMVAPWCSIPAVSGTSATLPIANFPLLGAQLLADTGFDDASKWSPGAGISIGGSQCTFTAAASGTNLTAVGNAAISSGQTYLVRFTVVSITQGAFKAIVGGVGDPNAGNFIAAAGTYSAVIRAAGSGAFAVSAVGTTSGVIDSVTIQQIGTASIANRAAGAGAFWDLGVDALGFLIGTANDGTTPRVVVSAASYAGVGFILPTLGYDTSGSLTLRVNGVQVAQATGAPLLTMNNASAVLTIGRNFAGTSWFPGSISITDIGATVPSDDASRWMYEQEKEMFRDGAQVTLPDSGAVVDLDYDPVQDKWKVVSAANESSFVGNLVRTLQAPVSAGSFTHAAHRGGIKLLSRSTTNPGVDITIPAKNALEELNRRAEDARSLARLNELFDWSGQFVGTTATGFNTLTGVSGLVIPMGTTVVGAQIGGVGIPANTAVLNQVGTTLYLSANDTANGAASPQLQDYILPGGYEARDVFVSGALQREGSGFQYTRLYDGFRERVRLNSLPGNVSVRVNARRMA